MTKPINAGGDALQNKGNSNTEKRATQRLTALNARAKDLTEALKVGSKKAPEFSPEAFCRSLVLNCLFYLVYGEDKFLSVALSADLETSPFTLYKTSTEFGNSPSGTYLPSSSDHSTTGNPPDPAISKTAC